MLLNLICLLLNPAFAQLPSRELPPLKKETESQRRFIDLQKSEIDSAILRSKFDLSLEVGETELQNYSLQEVQLETQKDGKGKIYIIWGYNRNFHTTADTTFSTPNGTFTIHRARGVDRPTGDWKSYVDPTKFTEPQYNFRIGYSFNSHWAVEVGTDHMKWIFVPDTGYTITGDYNSDVWVQDKDSDGNWSNDHPISFEEAKQTGNTSFLRFEHSDGFNYVNAGIVYTKKFFADGRFSTNLSFGAGAGLMVPKTRFMIRDTADGNWRDIDNKYHVAGWGVHADIRIGEEYKFRNGNSIELLFSVRGTQIDVNDALLLKKEFGRMDQEPIRSIQTILGLKYSVQLGKNKKAKRKARN